LFIEIPVGNKLAKLDLVSNGKTPVYSSESLNNGIAGNTDKEPKFIVNNEHSVLLVFGDHTRCFNIATESFCVMDNVKVLQPKNDYSIRTLLYIVSAWQKCIPNKGYSRHWGIAKKVKFNLPVQKKQIDFDFMERFIAELETQRYAELEAYLSVTGLKDTRLSFEEERALREFGNIEWGKFRLGALFERVETNKLPFKADDLPKQMTGKFTLPCLTSSFRNQGLNYFVPKDGATILKNVISIPSNSDVYRAYFQSNEFTVLSDAYAIRWTFDDVKLLPAQYLFVVSCINKVTDLPMYSYKNKLGGWNVVKNKYIQLPIKNDKPDYEIMDALISAIKKLAIKDVVLYSNRKIEARKTI